MQNNTSARLRSSMDRILDSGSNDWGSTPHGDTTTEMQSSVIQVIAFLFFIRVFSDNTQLI